MRISDWSSDVCSSDLLHLHRCRHIMVAVTYNGETIDRKFAPGATIARVKRWAAERKFGMTEEEAGEHVLQIAGTHERPAPGTHIGVLANRKTCGLARSEEHTSELQSLMRNSSAVFCLKKKK